MDNHGFALNIMQMPAPMVVGSFISSGAADAARMVLFNMGLGALLITAHRIK
jgi:hypothetical protein